jgi:hypothetical protein
MPAMAMAASATRRDNEQEEKVACLMVVYDFIQ